MEASSGWLIDALSFLEQHDGAFVVVFTLALAISTIGLWIATRRLAKVAENQSTDMKAQLALAERQFAATHRPKIKVRHLEAATEMIDGDPAIAAIVHYVNAGTSVARSIVAYGKISTFVTLTPGIQLPEIPANRADRESGVQGEFAVSSTISVWGHQFKHANDSATLAPHQIPRVYCIGKVTYEDVLGAKRETGFCREWVPSEDRWATVDNPEYEYSF